MCTVTLIPVSGGIRLAANRDESPHRPAALPPRIETIRGRAAVMPIDPLSGGTWIAATDAGLVFTLLNAYPEPRDPAAPTPRISRGTIIPRLLDSATLDEAYDRLADVRADDYAAFRLVLADRTRCADVCFAPAACERHPPCPIGGPLLFTSSGLGDKIVDPPRRELFDAYFAAGKDWRERQDAYHRHSWPDRRHLSVCMLRPEARTVSFTTVELLEDRVNMDYLADAPDVAGLPFGVTMAMRH